MFNGDYISIPEDTGSCGYLFHEIPGIIYTMYICIHITSLKPGGFKREL